MSSCLCTVKETRRKKEKSIEEETQESPDDAIIVRMNSRVNVHQRPLTEGIQGFYLRHANDKDFDDF